uniref:Uncharacterized protein n=1 Tax=Candidatus Kentrum sp. FM TaxID=2126340 RepID=A0A450TAT3_9GAMM|nr:MAG: hypothetical protein BECKFM1743A_GA0114220_103408 [Candidatus Kentron sp. FM]VFJ65919.1 MAG: hypothetical protein BECKFM1743C_GA0114222_104066 [Candidatus Kentron sp. FM]VFK14896.1 MAG: hypothetical protein BECKFM1743B_GA0114221_103448 [Candidatus Kentron sp. FM]
MIIKPTAIRDIDTGEFRVFDTSVKRQETISTRSVNRRRALLLMGATALIPVISSCAATKDGLARFDKYFDKLIDAMVAFLKADDSPSQTIKGTDRDYDSIAKYGIGNDKYNFSVSGDVLVSGLQIVNMDTGVAKYIGGYTQSIKIIEPRDVVTLKIPNLPFFKNANYIAVQTKFDEKRLPA